MALTSLRPLKSRNFALLWSAALVSNVGSWMQTVALGVVVTSKTHDPLWTGLVAAAAFVPMGLLAPVGGALADRLDRRRWLVVTTMAEAAWAAVLAVLAAHHSSPGPMVAVAFAGGVCAAVGFPAYQAMLPDLVPREQLLAAVSLSSAQFNLGRVIGPALAGVVLVAGSDTLAFAVNSTSFAAVVVALLLLRLPPHTPSADAGEPFISRVVTGARLTLAEPGCRAAIGLISVVALVGSPFIALVPAMAIETLHHGAAGTSVLVTAQGVGAVIGALVLAPLAMALGRRRLLLRALFAFPVALVVYGLSPNLLAATAALVVVGACYIGVLTGLNTVVQLRAPTEARARVLSLYMMALGTIYPIGAVTEGAIARVVGTNWVMTGAGILLTVFMFAFVRLRPAAVAALDDQTSAPVDTEYPAAEVIDPSAPSDAVLL